MRGHEITIQNLINNLYNSGCGFWSYKPKVFLIGFNKCGTTSLHKFFQAQGLRSVHWMVGERSLAVEVAQSVTIGECKKTFSVGQVFSDFTFLDESDFVEPLEMYPLWSEAFPDAYFILNDRNVDDWLRSRRKHRKGTFIARYMKVFNMSEEEVLREWRARFLAHRKDVLKYFEGKDRFCHFYIGQDQVEKISQFLSTDYRLDAKMFGHVNSSHPNA